MDGFLPAAPLKALEARKRHKSQWRRLIIITGPASLTLSFTTACKILPGLVTLKTDSDCLFFCCRLGMIYAFADHRNSRNSSDEDSWCAKEKQRIMYDGTCRAIFS